MFLIVNLLWASTFLAIYWGDPWKVRLYQNCIIFPIFLIDLVVGIVFFFTTEKISKTFEFKEISNETSASILGIVLAGTFLQQIYNLILHKCVNNTQLFSEK